MRYIYISLGFYNDYIHLAQMRLPHLCLSMAVLKYGHHDRNEDTWCSQYGLDFKLCGGSIWGCFDASVIGFNNNLKIIFKNHKKAPNYCFL